MTQDTLNKLYRDCTLCPRACHADRFSGRGFCGVGAELKAAKAMLHRWEEPCIAGKNGSGAIFFSGCTLRCIYCQNHELSHDCFGIEISTERLEEIIYELSAQGAETIEFVTASQYIPTIAAVLERIKKNIKVPVVFNCGGYESVESLRMLEGLIDIYMPDVKYYSDELAVRLSSAPHYFETAVKAVREMIRQVGRPRYGAGRGCYVAAGEDGAGEAKTDPYTSRVPENAAAVGAAEVGRNTAGNAAAAETADISAAEAEDTVLSRGVIIRHLVLPGCRQDSIRLIEELCSELGADSFLISLMSQYTPFYKAKDIKELNRRVTSFEYDSVLKRAEELKLKGFMQERSSAKEEYTPAFDLSGIVKETLI